MHRWSKYFLFSFVKKTEAVASDSVCGANINIKIIMRFAIMILVIASLVFSGLV